MRKPTRQGARLGAALALALLTGCSAAARGAAPATREQAAATREQAPAEQTAGDLTLPAFTDVRVDAVTTDVSFRYGSGYALHYELPEGELLEQAEVQDGTLLFCTESEPDSSLPHHGQLVITLPEDTELGEIRVYTSFGSLTFDGQANSLVYDTSSGDAEIGGVLAGGLEVDTSFGSLTFDGRANSLKYDTSSGDAEIGGVLAGGAEVDTSFGSLTFDGQANSLVYDTSSGDAEIGGVLADSLEVDTSFGSLRFTGQTASLDFESSKGGAQVTGKITDTLQMNTTTGPLTATLPDPALHAETGGKLTVDGVEQAGSFSRQGSGCSARITSSRGDITITTRAQ